MLINDEYLDIFNGPGTLRAKTLRPIGNLPLFVYFVFCCEVEPKDITFQKLKSYDSTKIVIAIF